MGLFRLVCIGLLAVVVRTQVLENCSVDTNLVSVASTEDAAILATSLQCSNGDFAVHWIGEVFVEETIFVTGGTSLNVTGAGPGAIADGGGSTQLFYVDGGSSLHLSDMNLVNGTASYGGAIFANQSSVVSFSGNMSFISNTADSGGGAIAAYESDVSWVGDGTEFVSNYANTSGGAIAALNGSTVSWDGDDTEFSSNSAGNTGGAITAAFGSAVSWNGDGARFSANSADLSGGAIAAAFGSAVSWIGDGTAFISNSAGNSGGAVTAASGSAVSWNGDGTNFGGNSADFAGSAIYAFESTVSWDGDGTQLRFNNAGFAGAIYADSSTVSWAGHDTNFSSNSGGAVYAADSSTVSWVGDGTEFVSNYDALHGGAICVYHSKVSWDGNGTQFSSNAASSDGGAIFAYNSTVSWGGFGTLFASNSAEYYGGAVSAWVYSNLSWDGDGTAFSSNRAGSWGGALYLYETSSAAWRGHGTAFSFNSADRSGGAIFAQQSSVRWAGDGTRFTSNSVNATESASSNSGNGGAIYAVASSNVSWDGDGTVFDSNFASASGGAIYMQGAATVSWGGHQIFSSNVAGEGGGALASVNLEWRDADDLSSSYTEISGFVFFQDATFTNNSAYTGGAISLSSSEYGFSLNYMTFENNSAGGAGGAIASYDTGNSIFHSSIKYCNFSGNVASEGGGAVEASSDNYFMFSSNFEGNAADVGGAVRLVSMEIRECSFLSNVAYVRGPAVAVIRTAEMSNSSFDGNELSCAADSYMHLHNSEEEEATARYETVCLDCPPWEACSGCSIARGDLTPTCVAPLEHTTSEESGVTIETLKIDQGYWRATTESDIILACYNTDACRGGKTGADDYCATGYNGPYCAVCETGYSPSLAHTCTRCSSSRRQGLVAATVIAALVAVLAVVAIVKFLLSTEDEEGDTGGFRRRVLRAVPVQALKIIVVVWQILTQFADAANVTYPGVYQDFLSAIDVVNFDLGSVLAAGCLWSGIDFHGRLLVSTLGPLVVVGFLGMTYRIAVRRTGASSESAVEKIRHKHQTALLLLTFLVYSSVSSMVFQAFAYETLDDGIEYLRADYRIHCTDDKHKAFEVYAGFMAFVYPLGIPLLYTVLLFQRREVLADADADKTVAQPIAGLWEAYRPERFYYEVIECGRRILLTGVVVFIFPNTAAQIAITMLIAFFFYAVFDVLSPYESESDTWLSRGGHVIVFLSMFDLLLLKVDVSGERDQSQAAFAGVLVAGHVLMILAIVVEVVALCFASRKKKIVEGGAEASERPRVGSDDVPVFESAPASWGSFLRQRSVSEKTGPTRSVSGAVVSTGGP